MKKLRLILLSFTLIGLLVFMVFQYQEQAKKYYNVALIEIKQIYFSFFPYKDKYFTYITPQTRDTLTSWLQTGQYEKLNDYFIALGKKYKSDIKYENKLYESYITFAYDFNFTPEQFADWIKAYPDSAIPLVGRAYYHENIALIKRGGAYISKTSTGQITDMHKYMEMATMDAEQAIERNPKNLMSWLILIKAYSFTGRDKLKYLAYTKALKFSDSSYILRSYYQTYTQAKWGGSDAYYYSYTKKQLELTHKYPWLSRLMATYYLNLANNFLDKKNIKNQIQVKLDYINKSLTYDRYWESLHAKGRLLRDQKKYSEAISAFSEAIMRNPDNFYSRLVRGKVYRLMEQYEYAEKEFSLLLDDYPTSYGAHFELIETYDLNNKYEEAILLSKKAISIVNKGKDNLYSQRSDVYFKQAKSSNDKSKVISFYKLAIDASMKSLEINDKNARVWNRIGYLSVEYTKDYKLAIKSFKRSLELNENGNVLYDYALSLYRDNDKGARKAYEYFYDYCKTNSCQKPSVVWAKLFIDCLNGLSSCELDKEDYVRWLEET